MGDSLVFNAGISVIWVAIIFIWGLISNKGWFFPTSTATFYGVLYGLNLSMFLLFKCQSFVSGPVSLSALIGSCGFIIATIFSTIYNKESMGVIQIIGMCLMIASIYMCINPKKSGMKLTTQWKIYAFLFFCTGGMIGVINKLFQSSSAKEEIDSMMLVASITSAVVLTVVGFGLNKAFKKPAPKISVRNFSFVGACGVVSCVYNRLNVFLAGALPGVILFPVSNGCLIFASSILGVLFFKEKLSVSQKLGIVFGFISIILIGCF
ncbi:MAG: hypothetical protein J6X30_00790 [Clostridia bacterium]|nr:hypothetical protein [Clostridia bacterium]